MISKNEISMVSSNKNWPIKDCHLKFVVKKKKKTIMGKSINKKKHTTNLTPINGNC